MLSGISLKVDLTALNKLMALEPVREDVQLENVRMVADKLTAAILQGVGAADGELKKAFTWITEDLRSANVAGGHLVTMDDQQSTATTVQIVASGVANLWDVVAEAKKSGVRVSRIKAEANRRAGKVDAPPPRPVGPVLSSKAWLVLRAKSGEMPDWPGFKGSELPLSREGDRMGGLNGGVAAKRAELRPQEVWDRRLLHHLRSCLELQGGWRGHSPQGVGDAGHWCLQSVLRMARLFEEPHRSGEVPGRQASQFTRVELRQGLLAALREGTSLVSMRWVRLAQLIRLREVDEKSKRY